MTITYPLTLPSTPGAVSWRIRAENAVGRNESPFNFAEQIYRWPGARWRVDFTVAPMLETDDPLRDWIGAMVSLNGIYGTFLLGDPYRKTPRGVATGTPLVKGANQTGSLLVVDGWTPSAPNIMKAGDYFQLGSGSTSKLKMVVKTFTPNGSGDADIDIWPPIPPGSSPADNAPLTVTNCKGVFRLDQDFGWGVDNLPVTGFSFSAHEALP